MIVPARYNFLYPSSRPACGRPPRRPPSAGRHTARAPEHTRNTVRDKTTFSNFAHKHPVVLVVGLAILGLLGAYFVAFILPTRIISSESVPDLRARLELQNDVRATLLPGLAGILFLTTAYFTWRQLQTNAEQLRVSQRQLEIGREGQITERYIRAVEQLGSAELDVRLGGIFALGRLSETNEDIRVAVMEVLTAYVRGHSPWPPRLPGQYIEGAPIEDVPPSAYPSR
jgi:hypothetical protein